jgi:flavin reductase (DIM6/NTAB) family NADH-FMN oxidoreductase RutF
MAKATKGLSGALFPTPAVMVTTISGDGTPNIITLAWVGVVCSSPFMVSVSIRPSRHSHQLLKDTPELVINVPTADMVAQTDLCGTVSGRSVDKFEAAKLTPAPSETVGPPSIEECPISLECKVVNRLELGTHDMFVCEVTAVRVDEEALDESGKIDPAKLKPFAYLGTDYRTLAEKIGHYGYTKKGRV